MFIEIKGLKKFYKNGDKEVAVLKGIDCEIEEGKICVFLGPSGSGKSTLLNILGGIEVFEEGSVKVNDRQLGSLKKRALDDYRRSDLGFIFQFYNLIQNLTVKENIEVGAYLSKNPLPLDELLETLGMYEHRNKYPNQLSGGQQQRTGIGRALIKNPALLICDEPTGALDYSTSLDVLKLMQEVNRKYKTTMLVATHNTAIAEMAHESFILHDGLLVENKKNEHPTDAKELVW
ncbi:MAG: ABC transporter ATP-binding protein [Eubacteriales bacterium]|nr:ABC transporter ATP-binding protein [Eubacteriales bacterium]